MENTQETKLEKSIRYGRYTARGVIATIGIYLIWDLYVFIRFGGHATESTQVGTWFYQKRWVLFLWGTLTGHLLVSAYAKISDKDLANMIWVLVGGVSFGIFITKMAAKVATLFQ